MEYSLLIFVFILSICGQNEIAAKKLPPFIETCKISDPELNKCIVEKGNKAIQFLRNDNTKYKIQSISPLKINEAVLESNRNLELKARNIEVWGLADAVIVTVDFRQAEELLITQMHLPKSQILGDYEIDGKIGIFPVKGTGKLNVTSTEVNLSSRAVLKRVQKNGIDVIKVESVKSDFVVGRTHYQFGNLFPDNAVLAEEIQKVLNENWEELNKEFYQDFVMIQDIISKNLILQILEDVKYDEVFTS